jgi:hypothetical protein
MLKKTNFSSPTRVGGAGYVEIKCTHADNLKGTKQKMIMTVQRKRHRIEVMSSKG